MGTYRAWRLMAARYSAIVAGHAVCAPSLLALATASSGRPGVARGLCGRGAVRQTQLRRMHGGVGSTEAARWCEARLGIGNLGAPQSVNATDYDVAQRQVKFANGLLAR